MMTFVRNYCLTMQGWLQQRQYTHRNLLTNMYIFALFFLEQMHPGKLCIEST